MANVASQIRTFWVGLSRTRQLLIGGAGLVVMLGLLWVAFNGVKRPSAVLMSDLTSEDAAAMAERLESWQVPYRVGPAGNSILVDPEQVHELRLRLAGEGLPRGGGVGFEIFNEPVMGQSRFAEQLNYRRALEGELRRTIRQIEIVRDARVHIVIPERRLFAEEGNRATAAITLTLQPGRALSDRQVQGITHLVASSVPNLSADEVTVVDSRGNVLARGGQSAVKVAQGAVELQGALEMRLAGNATAILERAVGPGNASVTVQLDLDTRTLEVSEEVYDPESVLRSERLQEEGAPGTAAAEARGVPGTRTNLTGTEDAEPDRAASDGRFRRSTTRNFEIGKTIRTERDVLARTKRLTVAVLLGGMHAGAALAPFDPPDEAEVARLTELVKNAVGFQEGRDAISVVVRPSTEFTTDPPAPEPVWIGYAERFWRPGLVVLTVVSLLAMLALRRSNASRQVQSTVVNVPRTVREIEAELEEQEAERRALKPAWAQSEPDRAALVVKGWLNEA